MADRRSKKRRAPPGKRAGVLTGRALASWLWTAAGEMLFAADVLDRLCLAEEGKRGANPIALHRQPTRDKQRLLLLDERAMAESIATDQIVELRRTAELEALAWQRSLAPLDETRRLASERGQALRLVERRTAEDLDEQYRRAEEAKDPRRIKKPAPRPKVIRDAVAREMGRSGERSIRRLLDPLQTPKARGGDLDSRLLKTTMGRTQRR